MCVYCKVMIIRLYHKLAAAKYTVCSLIDNDCLIRVYQSFVAIFQKNISYYAGNMFNASIMLKIMLA